MTPMAAESVRVTAAPTGLSERALGPDLARGVMLLFIALANAHYFLLGLAGQLTAARPDDARQDNARAGDAPQGGAR